MSLLTVKDVCKSFGKNKVLQGITFEVHQGEVLIHHRPVRIRQIHPPALPDPAGAGGYRLYRV